MVVASAGNTGRAFARACSDATFPCLIVIPERMLERLWLPCHPHECVGVVIVRDSNDYDTARAIAKRIAIECGVDEEGGVKNVARRDGIGTTMLEYARRRGRLPSHYVQAVSSGAGALAAYESSLRLLGDGCMGSTLPMLHLVQNAPCSAIHDLWTGRSLPRQRCAPQAKEPRVARMFADVLANSEPPFDVPGGVKEVLEQTHGHTYSVDWKESERAKHEFEALEGVSVNNAAACACAGLRLAIARGRIARDDEVLLHITGGGEELVRRDFSVHPANVLCALDAAPKASELSGMIRAVDDLFVTVKRIVRPGIGDASQATPNVPEPLPATTITPHR
jgi:cysteate synthase